MASPALSRRNVHLVVLVHGLWGNPKHLSVAREELEEAYQKAQDKASLEQPTSSLPELRILVAQGNEGTHTYDGIDVCAGRVANEIDREVKRIEKDGSRVVRDFSVMGYSVGGLIARYVIGLLHSRDPSFFTKHRPINFTTLASPHVGIMKYRGRFWQWVAVQWGYSLLGRTGDQLYTWDKYAAGDERPLLEVMSDKDEIFVQALNSFQRIDFFANAVQDHTVTYPTGAINFDDPFVETPAKPGVEEEIIVETDDANIIRRWYTVPVQDGIRKGYSPSQPTLARNPSSQPVLTRRPEPSRALSTSRTRQKRMRLDAKRKKAPFLPPFLVFRPPFNWIFYALTPVFMPVFMVGVVIAFIVDSGRSRRRAKAIAGGQPLNEAIATAVVARRTGSASTVDSETGHLTPERLFEQNSSMQTNNAMTMVRMKLNSAARQLSNRMVRRTTGFDPESGGESDDDGRIMLDSRRGSGTGSSEMSRRSSCSDSPQSDETLVDVTPPAGDDGLGSVLSSITSWSRGAPIKPQVHPSSSSSRPEHGLVPPPTQRSQSQADVNDRTEYKASVGDKPYPHPAHDPSASPNRPDLTAIKDVKLELTDVQRRIIRNLNDGIDQTKWTKWLTWLPMVGNAHAAIVVRDGVKFPEQEHGRGIVRRWAENTVMHENRKR